MGGSGLIGFLQILMGWKEGHPGLREQSPGSLRGPPGNEGHAKDIATQMAGMALASELRPPAAVW